jgi:cbb3-type cytochrome oxidase subunit 3
MYKQFFQGMDYTHLPLFALLFFVALFVGVLVHVLFVRRRSDYDAVASLPLADAPASRGLPAGGSSPPSRVR